MEYTLEYLQKLNLEYLARGRETIETIVKITREMGETRYAGSKEYKVGEFPGVTVTLYEQPDTYNQIRNEWNYRRSVYITIGKPLPGEHNKYLGTRDTEVAFLSIGDTDCYSISGLPIDQYFVPGKWLDNLLALETIVDEKIAAKFAETLERDRQYLLNRLLIGKDV